MGGKKGVQLCIFQLQTHSKNYSSHCNWSSSAELLFPWRHADTEQWACLEVRYSLCNQKKRGHTAALKHIAVTDGLRDSLFSARTTVSHSKGVELINHTKCFSASSNTFCSPGLLTLLNGEATKLQNPEAKNLIRAQKWQKYLDIFTPVFSYLINTLYLGNFYSTLNKRANFIGF